MDMTDVATQMPLPPGEENEFLPRCSGCRRSVFLGVNPRKAIGPDSVPGRALGSCADQLVEVFTDIFNLSLLQAEAPTYFEKTTIIPVPKKAHATTHPALEHLDNKDTYIRLLLVDYSSTFNTIIPSR
eukprot:g45356.t1